MAALLEHLGEAPVRRHCMGGIQALNLTSFTYWGTGITTRSRSFCAWVSQVMDQGLPFLTGKYAKHGVPQRDHWVMWAPIHVNDQEGDSIFTARQDNQTGVWHYGLYFYSRDQQLHDRLASCVLTATVDVPEGNRRVIGHAEHAEEDGLPVTSFEITVTAEGSYRLELSPSRVN